jgi:hypothetical protein
VFTRLVGQDLVEAAVRLREQLLGPLDLLGVARGGHLEGGGADLGDGRLSGADRRDTGAACGQRGSRAIGPGEPDQPAPHSAQRPRRRPRLTVPAMFVVADLDQFTSVYETRAIYQADKTADKRLLVLPGQFDGFHGWIVLTNAGGGFSSTATRVAEFIAAHTGG